MHFNHLCFFMLGVCNDNLYRHSNNQSFILFPFICAQYPNIVEYFWIFEYYSNKFSVCEYYSIFVLVNFERANDIRYLIWSKKIFVATTASKRSSQNLWNVSPQSWDKARSDSTWAGVLGTSYVPSIVRQQYLLAYPVALKSISFNPLTDGGGHWMPPP